MEKINVDGMTCTAKSYKVKEGDDGDEIIYTATFSMGTGEQVTVTTKDKGIYDGFTKKADYVAVFKTPQATLD